MTIQSTLDYVDFQNSIEVILQEFVTNYLDWYVAFDYEDVRKVFERINKSSLTAKPVLHIISTTPSQGAKTLIQDDIEGYKVFLLYNVYIVVNEGIRSGMKRKFLLNELSGELKSTFDRYRKDFNMFKNVRITEGLTVLSGNPDNLYASRHELNFEIIKKIVTD